MKIQGKAASVNPCLGIFFFLHHLTSMIPNQQILPWRVNQPNHTPVPLPALWKLEFQVLQIMASGDSTKGNAFYSHYLFTYHICISELAFFRSLVGFGLVSVLVPFYLSNE